MKGVLWTGYIEWLEATLVTVMAGDGGDRCG